MKLFRALMMAAMAAALFCSPVQATPVATGCMTVTYPGTIGSPSYLDGHASFDSGPFANGIYDVFCANGPMDIFGLVNYSVVIYSLNDPAVGDLGIVLNPGNLALVEYILNQGYPGLPSAGFGNFTSDDVQAAIWTLLDGGASAHSLGTLPGYSPDRVAEILADAQANGGGLQPLCSGLTAYLANPVSTTCGQGLDLLNNPPVAQPLIFGVPRTCPGPPLLTSECAAEATGEVGVPYTSSLVASGGTAPYTFTITAGALPPGLTLTATGVGAGAITGTPTTGGAFNFTYSVVDSAGESGAQTAGAECAITITWQPQVTLGCVAATTGEVGTFYSASLTAAGGTEPYTFSITGGALPGGLTLNPATGAITGTPTTPGTFNFTATVVDQFGLSSEQTASVSCAITVTTTCTPVKLACVSTGTGTVGTFYTATLNATGGTLPYTFSIVSGSLPPGLTLDKTTGVISGTPTAPGTFSFNAKVVDSSGTICACNSYDTVCCSITIISNCTPVTLGCVSSTPGTVGTAYSATLNATGGTLPYTFSIISGSLPPGLALNKTTGTISGTPTSAGTFSFTAKVVDSSGSVCGCYRYDTVCCSIKINPPPSGCDCLVTGDTATIGYWQGPNGQALIKSLNGGSTATQLATWLANEFPYLYGAYAGADNLTGKSNADVAALFKTFFAIRGQKTKAQTLAAALAVYVTDSDLAGTIAIASGFNVSASGTGAKCYNVGCYGSSIGLANNKNYTVMALLKQANLKKKQGCFNATSFNSVFDGINRKGDRL